MPYPTATEEQIHSFTTHGYLVVKQAIDPADMAELEAACDKIIADTSAFGVKDWAWREGAPEERTFAILQAKPSQHFPALLESRWYRWSQSFAEALMGMPLVQWYDQFIAKPPGYGADTPWHQDEGYWGRTLADRGITCWMPYHDVDVQNGCMHFIPGGHRQGILEHRQPPGMKSDLLCCEVEESRAVPCPLEVGDVTFHHSKMPHMTTANRGNAWRRVLAQHFRHRDAPVGTDDDMYPWRVIVDQQTGERRNVGK